MKNMFRTSVVAVAASLAVVAVGVTPAFAKGITITKILNNALVLKAPASPTIATGGSSFDANLVQAALTQYGTLGSNNQNSFSAYSSSKSGVGRAGAISGALQIGFSDFPLNFSGSDTATPADYAQVPVALGGVAIVYNLDFPSSVSTTNGNGTANSSNSCTTELKNNPLILTGNVLAQIFAGKITKWWNAGIENANPNLTFTLKTPKAGGGTTDSSRSCLSIVTTPSISVESRTSGSGTTFLFTDYLSKVDPKVYSGPTSNAFAAAATTSSNSAALSTALSSTVGAIGYVEYGYSLTAGLPVARLVNRSGDVVTLTANHVLADATAGVAAIGSKFSLAYPASGSTAGFSITNATGATSYPIAGFSYAITTVKQNNYKVGVAATKFLLYLTQYKGANSAITQPLGQNLALANGYVPLPQSVQAFALKTIKGIVGSKGNSLVGTTN